MMYAANFKQKAREALRGNWGRAVGTGLVASLLGAGITAAKSVGSSAGNSSYDSISDLNGIIPEEFQFGYLLLLSILSFTAIVFTLVHFIVGGAATLGYAKFNLNLVDAKPASFADLFSEFYRFGAAFMMQLLRTMYTFFWTLLFVIPGIYASYGYAMTPYIMLEQPELTPNEAITKSKELMHGNRWRLFCLEISFIGWILLAALLTCGIGMLWVTPYMEAATAAFYREICEEKYGKEQKEEPFNEFYYGNPV